ncbi:MAG: GntR family transcriptional regulator [Casimicrobiaceae bacterium]
MDRPASLIKRLRTSAAEVHDGKRPLDAKTPRITPRLSIDGIYQRVLSAILEHQLPPGTQLVEERLASVFGVSRTKIRQALARLAHDSIVTVVPNRGAFVSSPTVEEAREVFEARRLIEPSLVERVACAATAAQIARLREHVALESAARAAGDKRSIIRLSGEFHQIIAEAAGNSFLARAMRELETLTCLVIILYDAPNGPSCPYHEHSNITDAVEAHDADRAAALMLEHLNHVESSLDLRQAVVGDIDLEAVFS